MLVHLAGLHSLCRELPARRWVSGGSCWVGEEREIQREEPGDLWCLLTCWGSRREARWGGG